MKKTTFLRLSALLFALLLLAAVAMLPASAATPKYTEKEISVSLQFTSDTKTYYEEYVNQGILTLGNETDETLEGTVELQFGYSYNLPYELNTLVTLTLPLELTPRITKTADFVIDIPSGTDICRVNLVGKNGKLLRSEDFPLYSSFFSGYIGWMSDEPKEAALFRRDIPDIGCEPLTPQSFPADFELMKRYSAIIVNNVDLSASSSFSAKQIALLKKYIAEGGTVIVGTGKNTDILNTFSEYFAGPIGAAAKLRTASFMDCSSYKSINEFLANYGLYSTTVYNSQTKWFNNYSPYETTGDPVKDRIAIEFLSVSVCDIEDERFSSCVTDGSHNIPMYKSDSGNLYLCGINLAEDALMNSSHSDGFLIGLFHDAGISMHNSFHYATVPTANLEQMEGLGPTGLSPLVPIVLLVLYAGSGILTPFIIAKAKRKPKIAIIGIPSASVLFAMVVILYGMVRHGFGPYAYSANVAVLESNGEATVYCAAKTAGPGGGKKKISFGHEDTRYFTNDYQLNYYIRGDAERRVSAEGNGWLESQTVSSWQEAYAGGYYRDTYAGAFDVTLIPSEDGNSFRLTVRNNTGKNLENAAVTVFGNTLYIGNFAAGAEYSEDGLTYQWGLVNPEAILLDGFYAPNDLSQWDMQNDIGNGFSITNGRIRLVATVYAQQHISYSSYKNNRLVASQLDSLLRKNEDSALAALTMLNAIAAYGDDGSAVLICGIDPDAESGLEVNGKAIRNAHHVTAVLQRIPVAEWVLKTMEYPESDGGFRLFRNSPCDTDTWDDGYVKLRPGESAVFLTPFVPSIQAEEYFRIQLESDEELTDCEAFVCVLPRGTDTETSPYQCKIDADNNVWIDSILLQKSMESAYYSGKGYGYENYLYLPDTSLVIPQEEVPVDELVLIIRNPGYTSKTVTVKGIEYAETAFEVPVNDITTEESVAPLPVPEIIEIK